MSDRIGVISGKFAHSTDIVSPGVQFDEEEAFATLSSAVPGSAGRLMPPPALRPGSVFGMFELGAALLRFTTLGSGNLGVRLGCSSIALWLWCSQGVVLQSYCLVHAGYVAASAAAECGEQLSMMRITLMLFTAGSHIRSKQIL